ncbi:cytochrome P450 [Kribbella sp. NPDC051587]|uniref:cytochrome P450 n=1 Tax=Kribbella sp. NPDC051587 TaxID=3364119 RepID=UPI0037AAD3D0
MKALKGVPEPGGALPLLGHALPLIRSPFEFLRSLHTYGDLVQLRLGPSRMVVVCTPELTHELLVRDRVFDKGGAFFERARDSVAGNGIFACPAHQHRRQRRLLQPAFHRANLPSYARVMSEKIAGVVDAWSDGQILDVGREMQTITSRIMLSAMLGDTLDDTAMAEIDDNVSLLVTGLYVRMLLPEALGTTRIIPSNRRYVRATERARQLIADAITFRRASTSDSHDDLLARLLEVRDVEGSGEAMSERELIDQVSTFYVAGSETTANTLAWVLALSAQHPQVARKLSDEADAALAGNTATWDELPQLTYTRNALSEALRLYPPAWLLTRTTTSEAQLGEYTIPAGTNVAYSPYIVGRLPDSYADPERFDPDRWSADAERVPSRNAFVAFGAGARKCIGDEFGMTEAVLALASIMKRFEVTSQPGDGHKPQVGASLRPKALRLKVTARG